MICSSSLLDLWSGQSDLDDPALNHGVVQLGESDISILTSRHGHKSKALASPVVVDDLGFLHVAELTKEHDKILLPENKTLQSRRGGEGNVEDRLNSPEAEGNVGHVEPLGKFGIARESCLRVGGSWPHEKLLKTGG